MPAATPPADLHAHLGYWLRMVSNAVSHSFARTVEAEGVTVAEWVFLRVLFDGDGMAPSALAARMGMTKGAISKLADRLVDKDLVTRTANPEGGRGQTLALKPAARALVPRLAVLADGNDALFFDALAPDEQAELRRLLLKIASRRGLKSAPTD
ncbi:MarR family winged helix-turn-helix transcriptional regulator [Azospirillum sp. B4]|uniref:MarR family winged helix-turn-helix transcriptional regulator n=1 Tax=Azospirillum sp. B4 TaxID=95605 RepID=UPI00034BEE64|nr:MarR family transcriptional regulator [Azospirillum sp. B4]